MQVATSVIDDQPAHAEPAAGETLYEFTESPLLARQRHQESNARSYPRRIPLALKKARGLYVEDVEGRRFIDCLAGAGTLALGHNHPVVIEAIQQVLADELLCIWELSVHVVDPLLDRCRAAIDSDRKRWIPVPVARLRNTETLLMWRRRSTGLGTLGGSGVR